MYWRKLKLKDSRYDVFRIEKLPDSWEIKTIKDVMSIRGGSQPPKSVFVSKKKPGYIRLVQIRDFKTDSYPTYIPEASTKKTFKKNDIMIARYGPPVFQILRGMEGAYNVALMKVEHGDNIHDNFVYYLLQTPNIHDFVVANSQRTAGQSGVNLDLLNNCQIPLPPLAEQKRIAAVLDQADRLRELRRQAIARLDDLLQSVFLDMFGDPVTNPMGWEVVEFEKILNKPLRNGQSPSSKGKYPGTVLTLSAITRGIYDNSAYKASMFDSIPPDDKYVDKSDFLICRGNGNLSFVGAGKFPSISNPEMIFPDTMIAANINTDICKPQYLEKFWGSRHLRTQIEGGARTTNGTFKINQKILESVSIAIPPQSKQLKFEKDALKIKKLKQTHQAHLAQLDNLFHSLQQRAFRGELFT